MEKKSVGLRILCWGEIVVSLRVLLFSLPVMINKNSAGSFSLDNLDDRFIGLLTLTAVLYFFVGVLAITGNKLWKAVHYLAVVLVLLFTLATVKVSGQALALESTGYYSLPLLFSVIITVLAGILGKKK